MSTYTDEQLQQLISFMEKFAEYNSPSMYDFAKTMMVEVLYLRSLLREVCEAAEHMLVWDPHQRTRYGCVACEFQRAEDVEPAPHTPDCPVGVAKKFLGVDQ